MNNLENGRDPELDEMLKPLGTTSPTSSLQNRWSALVANEMAGQPGKPQTKISPMRPLVRRSIEWAIAASIGFVAATVLLKNQPMDSDHSPRAQLFSGLDATEMHLMAKSE